MKLIFQVKNQRLYLLTVNKVVADSKNYLTAAFTFTDDWDGAVKVAQFTRGTTTTNVTIDASTGECVVPQSVLAGEGEFFVSVYGSINNEATIITANTIKIAVLPSGFIANPGTISQEDAAALQAHADAVTAVTNSSTTGAGGYVHQIVFTVRNQSMYLTTRGKVVADSQGYLGAKFLFSDDWDDVIKIAQFKRDDLFFSIKLDANDECTVPWEVLVDEGVFIANVFGNNRPNAENKIITVNPVEVHVEKSGLTDGELPSNPTMGIDGSVLYEITQYTERAEIAATTATNASADALASAQDAENSADSASASADTAASSAAAAANSATAAAVSAATASNAAQTVENYASGFAPLTSPAFDGIPTAPTATAGTNTDQIATTAYVQAELEDYATLLDLNDYVEVSSADYIKSASVSGDTLTLTKGNDTTITYTPDIPTKVSDLTNDAGYATTTYTNTAIADAVAGLVDSAPATLDTLNELADALGNDPNFATTVATQIGTKAPLASPALTGTPTAPTPTADDNSTRIATTAYVQAELADFALTNDLGDYLPLSGGTMTGSILFTGLNDRSAGIDLNNDGKNFDIGWNWTNRDGAGFYLRSTDFSATAGGGFGAYARNATNSYDLFGNPNGSLTWGGTSFTVGGGTGTITGDITGNVLTGYTKPSATSALAATDTLNGALGKLEKALDGKSNTSHTHSYLPLAGGTMTGSITSNNTIPLKVTTTYNDGSGTTYTSDVIRANTSNSQYGNNIAFGGGGNTIIGGGESYSAQLNALAGNSAENCYVCADGNVYIKPNCNTFANAKEFVFKNDGSASFPASIFADGLLVFQQPGVSAKGTNPSAWKEQSVRFADASGEASDAHLLGMVRNEIGTNGNVITRMVSYKNASGSSDNESIGVVYPASGDPYTFAPTPATSDNSSKIATTAYVKSNLSSYSLTSHTHSYLPLSGGTITGSIAKKTSLTKGTKPSSTSWLISNIIYDTAGTATANRMSEYRAFVDANGKTGTEIISYDFTSGATSNALLGVYKDLDGAAHVNTNGQLVINRNNGSIGGGIKLTGSAQNFAISAQNTNVTKGTAPSSTQYWGIDFYGKDIAGYSNRIGMLETSLDANNVVSTGIYAYNCTTNTNTGNASIRVYVDGSGNAYTYAPTPADSDDSTKIATTAWVRNVFLPLDGGTLSGNITVKKSDPRILIQDTDFTRGTAPSANVNHVNLYGTDSAGKTTWGIYHRYDTGKGNRVDLIAYKGTTTDNAWTGIGVGYDTNGNWFTYAPTPAQTNDSTAIATTAYVKDCVPKSVGSASKPVYVNANGVVTACTYELEKSVPSNAVFTDTHWTSHLYVGSGTAANAATTNGNTKIVNTDNSTVRNTITIKGTNATTVTSDANGVITINSTNTNNISATGTNYIRFNNNRQICWGEFEILYNEDYKTITFPAAFSGVPVLIRGENTVSHRVSIESITKTNFKVGNDVDNTITVQYIAIGSWS